MKDTTNVSIRADRAYTLALKALAYGSNRVVCDLIREAVDEKFGKELEPHLQRIRNNETLPHLKRPHVKNGDESLQTETNVLEQAHA